MALVTIADFRDHFSLDAKIKDGQISPSLRAASRTLRRWVGEELYATTDDEVKEDLKFAELNLAMHFAITGFNTEITVNGLVKTQAIDKQTVRSYLTPSEIAQYKQAYFEQAEQILNLLLGKHEVVPMLALFE